MIVIVDYGVGNLLSIANLLKKIGTEATISSDAETIRAADKLILPGVGSFDYGMKNLLDRGLRSVLEEKVFAGRTPFLGICLGMQMLTKGSEEGSMPGLGWIDAVTRRFHFEEVQRKPKIPHMGWNTVKIEKPSVLFDSAVDQRFYFVHSYHVFCSDPKDILTTTFYEYDFVSAFMKKNIVGVQFHPEKSHKFGMALFRNFAGKFEHD